MARNKIASLQSDFDKIAHMTDEGTEFWLARELQPLLGYKTWENFDVAIKRAITSCETAQYQAFDHFRDLTKMINTGKTARRSISDYMLTRYACYLIAQNIYERGVDEKGFGRIRSKGDEALFGGKTTQSMKERYEISENRPLADFLPAVTIAAKNLAAEITNHNVEENDMHGEARITKEHVQNNRSVRAVLGERGIKPEALPPSEDLLKLERKVKRSEKQLAGQSGRLPNSAKKEVK